MFRIAIAAAVLLVAGLTSALPGQESKIPLKKGDRIVFLGDSITAGGVGKKGYVTLIKNALAEKHEGPRHRDHRRRHQRQQGARPAKTARKRRPRQEADHRRHLHRHQRRLARREQSQERHLQGEVRGRPQGDHRQNQGLRQPRRPLHAQRHRREDGTAATSSTPSSTNTPTSAARSPRTLKLQLCDLRKAFVEHLKKNNPDNKASGVLTGDRVHLNAAGNALVAEVMMKSLAQ